MEWTKPTIIKNDSNEADITIYGSDCVDNFQTCCDRKQGNNY